MWQGMYGRAAGTIPKDRAVYTATKSNPECQKCDGSVFSDDGKCSKGQVFIIVINNS